MRIFVLTMGCAKNAADSEHLIAKLEACGHRIVGKSKKADCAIINTCGFIQDAVKENIDAIIDLENLKKEGRIKKLIVAGCLVNRYEKELRKEFSESVDFFARSEEWDKITEFLGGKEKPYCSPIPKIKNYWTRYLKISEGCNTLCSYCAIPMIRGRLRSVPMKRIIDEARIMCAAGAKELCLVGQDLTVYGQDFGDGTNLMTLLRELNASVPKGTWIRLLYLHPNRVNEELIDFLMTQDKILHYLDIPIQHSEPEILSLMNRPCPEGHMRRIFSYIRELDPLFNLRTTVMVGFPGEDAKSFKRLMDFVNDIEFDRLGAFIYSPEKGTKAYDFSGRIPKKTAQLRYNTITRLQDEIVEERNTLFVGKELDVIVDDIDDYGGIGWCRSYRDAPEVDDFVYACGIDEDIVKPGDTLRLKITDNDGFCLYGDVLE
ncbi:MAG: 30S ribosomal protein S12 methylthiotransferase RimO [Synergistaceae bacterium]|nr:30S ribosomal protein S12 methylthiotransferase RimO [Synergistaceae bacterium]